jgi:hypothetical protein
MAGDTRGVRTADLRARRRSRDVRHNQLIDRRAPRIAVLALAGVVLVAALAGAAHSAFFLLFRPTAATSGDRVVVRLAGTPATFTLDRRVKPLRPAMRVYLVPSEIAKTVRSRFDLRISFVGELVPDRNAHGLLTFTVPPLDTADYVAAVWCPGCAAPSSGRTFFVLSVDESVRPRFRPLMSLHVGMPSATTTCPVTRPNRVLPPAPGQGFPGLRYGNGLLSTAVSSDGGLLTQRDQNGTSSTKLAWLPRKGFTGTLTVGGERLDAAAPPMRVLAVYWGHDTQTGRGGWATPVVFPSEGCWRITGRVRDVTVSYVVRVMGV